MATKLSIINAALNYLGNPSFQTLDVANSLLSAMSNIYDLIKPDLLAAHPWSFSTKWFNLVKKSNTSPNDRYNYTYNMPPDVVRVWETYPNANYQIVGDEVLCNVSLNWQWRYVYDSTEANWSPGFVRLITYALAAECATLVTETPQLAQFWGEKAEMQMARARFVDSQSNPSNVMQNLGLIHAYYEV